MSPKRQSDKASSRERMRVARQRLEAANNAMNTNDYDTACNRCYYAVFETAHAMLSLPCLIVSCIEATSDLSKVNFAK